MRSLLLEFRSAPPAGLSALGEHGDRGGCASSRLRGLLWAWAPQSRHRARRRRVQVGARSRSASRRWRPTAEVDKARIQLPNTGNVADGAGPDARDRLACSPRVRHRVRLGCRSHPLGSGLDQVMRARDEIAHQTTVDNGDVVRRQRNLDGPARRFAGADIESAVVLGAFDRQAVDHHAVGQVGLSVGA